MKAKELREKLQTNANRLLSDWTRHDLIMVLKKTRQERGGLSLMEIAEVIKETLTQEEMQALKNDLDL